MIEIGKPEVVYNDSKARLQSIINIDGKINTVWFEVDEKYGKYLCYERSDAFVIGILNYAMRNGHDIKCTAPMGEELHYQITYYLIDALYKNSSRLYNTKIEAEIDSTILSSANAVGTGISCGIDSFHAISQHTNTPYPNHNISHLAFNNVGSHGEGEDALKLYNERKEQAKNFAKEFNFEFVEGNSNIHDIIPQNHFMTHTYTSTFAIYALQKLYSVFYYASGRRFSEFTLSDVYGKDCSYYDLLLSDVFSTSKLRIFSEGATSTRLEKTKRVAKYIPSYKYLNVCTNTANNCNICEKCNRTLLILDAIGKLDEYKSVFDIEFFKQNRQKYYTTLVTQKTIKNRTSYADLYPFLKKNVKLSSKIKGHYYAIVIMAKKSMPPGFNTFIKKLLRSKAKTK